MFDRVRPVWHERLGLVLTNVPVDIEVDAVLPWRELRRVVALALAAKRALAARVVAAGGARRQGQRGTSATYSGFPNIYTIRLSAPGSGSHRPASRAGDQRLGHPRPPFTTLPPAEAFRRAAEVHPRLRPRAPRAGCCASA